MRVPGPGWPRCSDTSTPAPRGRQRRWRTVTARLPSSPAWLEHWRVRDVARTGGGGDGRQRGPRTRPLTVELLADLQAGLLDDDTAARLRKQVRADPDAAADAGGARTGSAATSPRWAPTRRRTRRRPRGDGRIGGRARRSPRASHAVRRGRPHSALGAARGGGGRAGRGAVAAVWLGTVALMHARPRADDEPADHHRTHHVSRPPQTIPLSDPQILGPAPPQPRLRPARRPGAPRVLPVRSGLPGRRPRCLARGRSTSPGIRPCFWCCPPTRPATSSRWRSRRPAVQPTPACWPTRGHPSVMCPAARGTARAYPGVCTRSEF